MNLSWYLCAEQQTPGVGDASHPYIRIHNNSHFIVDDLDWQRSQDSYAIISPAQWILFRTVVALFLWSMGQAGALYSAGNTTVPARVRLAFRERQVGITADSIATPFVNMSGTFAQPGIGLNKKGVLLTGGAAVLTGGISSLVQGAADRATAEADVCADTLAEVGEHADITQDQ